MNILLEFDYDSHLIFVPDGYILNLQEAQNDFFSWLSEQPGNLVKNSRNQLSIQYNADDFLQYLNENVLCGTGEKAYYLHRKSQEIKKKNTPALRF